MHVREFCLCPECIARVGVHELEQKAFGRAWFEACKASRGASEPMRHGVVRRNRSAA